MINFEKLLRPIKNRILNMAVRGIIKYVNDTEDGALLKITGMADETLDDVENFQQYGYKSKPKKGAEHITLFLGGDRSHGITIATKDRRFELKEMQDGEVALYTDEGDKVHLKRGNEIEVKTKTLTITAPDGVNIETKELACTGEISDSGGRLSRLRDNYNGHVHIGNLGAATSPPSPLDSGV